MPLMRYKAMDERGRRHAGRIEAVNAADLETRLSRLGLDLITFREAKAARAIGPWPGASRGTSSDSASTWSSS